MSEAATGAGSTNPNINVTNPTTSNDGKGRIEIESGGGPLTFDELEQVLGDKKRGKSKDDKPKQDKSQDLTSDSDKGKTAKSDAKEKPEPKAKESKDSEKSDAEEKPARKTVKAKFQDTDLELDDETLIPVTVNGKEEMWTLKELRADKSGKVAWDKQFTELSKSKKEIGTKELKLQEISNKIRDAFEEPDSDMKMFKMAQIAGVDPIQFRQKFLNDNISLLEKFYAMSEDERKADALAYEAKIQKHRADTLEESSKQEQAHRALSAKIDSLRASHQVSEEEFASRYEQIEAYERQMAAKYSDYKPAQITPERIIETIEKDRLWNATEERIKTLSLGWNEETKRKNLLNMVDKAYTLGFKPNEMAEMVDELWGSKRTQRTIEAKQKQKDEFLHGKKDVPKVGGNSESEPLFFDEI
ncbi:MAG: hypothetical protein OM95_06945 [Bdellovibrio sp. ArHS]|uniref:hypothetical protein n=1 Tax=Bdellovibrio sp. ArHS TaxID=1569284 RepID=UPI0005838681|nr:hypothetical protein [Bdellovibrio sp. ArHS]KHD88847.1 MAG: hypothetical protein OM95_06945 [Bdellovibrio sp. ArHS]